VTKFDNIAQAIDRLLFDDAPFLPAQQAAVNSPAPRKMIPQRPEAPAIIVSSLT
jgi:hypothetical protein